MSTQFIHQTSVNSTTPFFASILKSISNIPNPIRVLRAYEELSKFRKLDSKSLQDMGLTREDVNQSKLADFFYPTAS